MRIWSFIFLVLLALATSVQAADRDVAFTTGSAVWILRIDDSTGNILESHHRRLEYLTPSLAISPVRTSSGLALGIFLTETEVDVAKIEVGLFVQGRFLPFHDFGGGILAPGSIIQATQKAGGNWLLARPGFAQPYESFGINSLLEWNGKKKRVSPAGSASAVTASVSADGKMLTESAIDKNGNSELLNQSLFSDATRRGAPATIDLSASASSVDCSNELPGDTRDVVYRINRVEGIDTIATQIFLQKIHGSSGKRLGSPISLTPLENRVVTLADSAQSVAIDSQSKFVLYTAVGKCGRKVLMFQLIDASGGPSSAPKIIFGCNHVSGIERGVENIDVSAN